MRKFHIVKDNEPSLRKRCIEVANPSDPSIVSLINDMHEYLVLSQDEKYREKHNVREGVGLAAPQIGENIRALVVLFDQENDDGTVKTVDYRLVNPKIISESVKMTYLQGGEGCLSVDASHEGYIYRPYKIIVKAFDVKQMKDVIITARGYEAVVLQHEMDHLNGVLFYDHIIKDDPFKVIPDAIRL